MLEDSRILVSGSSLLSIGPLNNLKLSYLLFKKKIGWKNGKDAPGNGFLNLVLRLPAIFTSAKVSCESYLTYDDTSNIQKIWKYDTI